jgi:glycosidase
MKKVNFWWAILMLGIFLSGCLTETPAPLPEPTLAAPTMPPATPTRILPTALPVQTAAPTEPPAPVTQYWWNDTVFYQVFVRSFYDTDGDGIGDLNGLIEKLDYLSDGDPATDQDLGVTGIWLMPITESPSYHGYDVVDYYTVEQDYGSNEDFLRLIDEAHQRGIRVIVDLVINHTSRENPWFLASQANDPQYRDWYIWSTENPGYRGPWDQVVWIPSGDDYYYAVFWEGMPDLNFDNPEVTLAINEVTQYWLEDMNVDGFRMDAIRHLIENGAAQENTPATHRWLQEYHKYYKSIDPQAFTVGEAWTTTDQVVDYVGDEMDIAFEFDLARAFMIAAKGPIVSGLYEKMQQVLDSYPSGQYGVFLTNHDQDRVMSELGDDVKAKLAATMMLTAPGVPFIYYGEEIGMTGIKPDEDIRRPMQWKSDSEQAGFTSGSPWRAPADDYLARSVDLQEEDPGSLLNHYRALIQLRSRSAALRSGDAALVEAGTARLYAMLRYNQDEAYLILVNVHPQALPAERYSLSLESGPFSGPVQVTTVLGEADASAPEINANGGFTEYKPLPEIPGQSSVIIQLKP